MKTKQSLRQHIQEVFQKQPHYSREVADRQIEREILKKICNDESIHSICIYEHIRDEVATSNIIGELIQNNTRVFVPQILSETQMQLIEKKTGKPYSWDIDVFFVPGRAFSKSGSRLGRGKWYYDRFLSQEQYKKSKKVGICYDFQILESIPVESHDIDMDCIVTNTFKSM